MSVHNEVHWGLKPRDFEILRLIVAERSIKDIANQLHVSRGALTQSMRRVYAQIGVESMVGAAVWATKHGIEPETKKAA